MAKNKVERQAWVDRPDTTVLFQVYHRQERQEWICNQRYRAIPNANDTVRDNTNVSVKKEKT